MANEKVPLPRRVQLAFLVMTLIFLAILVGFAVVITNLREVSDDTHELAKESKQLAKESKRLAKENKIRITEIQVSRVSSCQHTYSGVKEVFKPFFPPPEQRTPAQQADLDKFNKTIRDLRKGCLRQTLPKPAGFDKRRPG